MTRENLITVPVGTTLEEEGASPQAQDREAPVVDSITGFAA
jgi:hypothetical protein